MEDIPVLAQHFIKKESREMGSHSIPTLAPDANADGSLHLDNLFKT
jgi:hypothetical protein